ncbi:hypothetical protein [Nocardia huaxiensis]|nr:hypothetical protein [Nocardia huaxiensis]
MNLRFVLNDEGSGSNGPEARSRAVRNTDAAHTIRRGYGEGTA